MKHPLFILALCFLFSALASAQTFPIRGTMVLEDNIRQTFNPGSTNAGVTTAGAFLSNYVGDQLWKTDDYGTAEARIQKYNLRFTSVVEYVPYLLNCQANLTEILENL